MASMEQLLVRSVTTALPTSSGVAIQNSFGFPQGRGEVNKIAVMFGTENIVDLSKIDVTVKINGTEVLQSVNAMLFLSNNTIAKALFKVVDWKEASTLDVSYAIAGTLSSTIISSVYLYFD